MNIRHFTLGTVAVALLAGGAFLFGADRAGADSQTTTNGATATTTATQSEDTGTTQMNDSAQADDMAQADDPAKAAADENGIVEMTLGAEDAPVTIMEYASFTCPHCAHFHDDQFKKLKAEYIDTGKVRFIYRDVYFDRIGLWAAMLARCESDKFFGISDLIYGKQGEWLNSRDPVVLADNLRKLGRVAGLSDDRIDACMQDADKARALVDWFEENRKADDINATPTLVIDGVKHDNMSYDDLKKIIDGKLGG